MSFLLRDRSPWFGHDQSHPRASEPAPETVAAVTGLPVATPAPEGVTDHLSASRRINALAFNAVTQALSKADVFVRLTDRQRIASAVLEAIQDERERQVREEVAAQIESADADPSSEYERGLVEAARIARGER